MSSRQYPFFAENESTAPMVAGVMQRHLPRCIFDVDLLAANDSIVQRECPSYGNEIERKLVNIMKKKCVEPS